MVEGSLFKHARALVSVGLVAAAFGLGACGNAGPAASDTPSAANDPSPGVSNGDSAEAPAGSVTLDLDLAGAHLASANYTIIGGSFQTSGSFDISNSTRISGIVSPIPFGDDYAVTLSADTTDAPALSCNGSASFRISSAGPTTVNVPVSCRGQKEVAVAAPIPPVAPAVVFLLLLGIGMSAHFRSARSRLRDS